MMDYKEVLDREEGVVEMISEGGIDVVDLFEAWLDFNLRQATKKLVRCKCRCEWHVHKETEKCGSEAYEHCGDSEPPLD